MSANTMHKINFKEELKFGKTFCPLPFINYHLDVEKKRKVCCQSSDAIDDTRLTEIRNSILSNQEVPECNTCYNKEKQKLISQRQIHLKEWIKKELFLDQAILQHSNNEEVKLLEYDLRYSNLCNLECQMCNATNSSAIASRQGKVVTFLQHEPEIDNISPDAHRIYFAGGEPFLIKSFSKILNNLTNTDCEIVINTNATILTDHILESLDRFSNVSFIISVDGFGELNNKIRVNSRWEDIDANVDTLANRYGGYSKFLINTVIQQDNVNHLLEIGQWIESKGITQWKLNVLKHPEELSFTHCTDIVIPDELTNLSIVKGNIQNTYTINFIKNYAQ